MFGRWLDEEPRHREGGWAQGQGGGLLFRGPFIFEMLYMPDVLFILTDDPSNTNIISSLEVLSVAYT